MHVVLIVLGILAVLLYRSHERAAATTRSTKAKKKASDGVGFLIAIVAVLILAALAKSGA